MFLFRPTIWGDITKNWKPKLAGQTEILNMALMDWIKASIDHHNVGFKRMQVFAGENHRQSE
jgi:hypothetical protein